jgi:AAA15 family ATPase/GTPase
MKQHFIKNIAIKNFKCFESFEAKGFNRVNLITGKNNTGKTALMEAMEFFLDSSDLTDMSSSLRDMISRRQDGKRIELDLLHCDKNNMSISIDKKKIGIEFINRLTEKQIKKNERFGERDAPFLKLSINGEGGVTSPLSHILERYNRFSRMRRDYEELTNINFIPYGKIDSKLTAIHYGNLIDNGIESLLDDALNNFDKNIKGLKLKPTEYGAILKLSLVNRKTLVLLSSLGEGVGKYIAIITAIVSSTDGCLFIDEIDNGIHYSKLDELWEVILDTSKILNVQIFATTHSKECIDSYARVAKKLRDEDVTLIELGKNEDKIESVVFNYNGILHHIEQKLEVRGW